MSTFASANCTPEVLTELMPGCHSASAVIGCGPMRLHASAHDRRFDGVSFTWMLPPVATSASAVTPSAGATFSISASSAFSAAMRIPGLVLAAVVLPPDPALTPYCVSPICGVICDGCNPSASAVTIATSVRCPVPMSCVPSRIVTLPSDAISQCAGDGPRPLPPHVQIATPMPVLIDPDVESPVGCRLLQPNSCAPSRR